jgi:5-hydroxyisourate hydrolase
MGISTHILDTTRGRPATGVAVTLESWENGGWSVLHMEKTDADGRCRQMLPEGRELAVGPYRLRFATGDYFAAMGVEGLYPWVEIPVEVRRAEEHFHIPLLLTANGFTTYRGS